jgi:hypothetical protein
MLILTCLGTGITFFKMDTTEDKQPEVVSETEGREVEEVYNSQKKLEEEKVNKHGVPEEEEEALLARGPDEDDNTDVNPDILDVTMEDASLDSTTTADPNPITGGKANPNTKTNPISECGLPAVNSDNPNKGDKPATAKTSNMLNKYRAARSSYKNNAVPNLNGDGGYLASNIGSFLVDNDRRIEALYMESDVSNGKNISYSFNPNTLECGCCGKFGNRAGGEKLVWVFTDQNFSPILPNVGDGQCMKIVRFENGNLLTMVSSFLVKHSTVVVNGDIVLVGSASQLAREGLVGYVNSLLETTNRVRLGSRRECVVLPGPFILLGGCTDPPF